MKGLVKRLVVGTRWEVPVKRVHYSLTRSKNSLYDAQTIAVMERVLRPDSNAIDVGCFEGGILRHMVRLAPRGRHVAFEPLPDRSARLGRAFPNVRVHPYALAEAPGESTFQHVVHRPPLSGLRRRVDLAPGEDVREIRVPVETLDRVVPGDLEVAFVKIDVEGGELGVLRGGAATLRRTRPVIVFECGLGGADSYGTRPEQVFDALSDSIGLRISTLESWLAGGSALSRDEFREQFERSLHYTFLAHP